MPALSDEQVQAILDNVTRVGKERVRTLGLEGAHNITFSAGAMAVFEALGLWEKVPMAWHIAMLRQSDPFTGQLYSRDGCDEQEL